MTEESRRSPVIPALKAWRIQFDDWMAIAYARSRGDAAIQTVRWYGLDPESFLSARVYRIPKLDALATKRGVEERLDVWMSAGFNPDPYAYDDAVPLT